MRRLPNQPHPGEAYALTYGTVAIECRPQLGKEKNNFVPTGGINIRSYYPAS